MKRTLLFSFIIFWFSCSSDENERLLIAYPQDFTLTQVGPPAIESYYYTDTIIYLTNNNFVDSLQARRTAYFEEEFSLDTNSLNDFLISKISFTDIDEAQLTGAIGQVTAQYNERGGLGNIVSNTSRANLGFRIDPDLSRLQSCYTFMSKRSIDTLLEDNFRPDLEILYDRDSIERYQLVIEDANEFWVHSCNPLNVQESLSIFAQQSSLVNNDRIVVYRRDLIFQN